MAQLLVVVKSHDNTGMANSARVGRATLRGQRSVCHACSFGQACLHNRQRAIASWEPYDFQDAITTGSGTQTIPAAPVGPYKNACSVRHAGHPGTRSRERPA